MWSKKSIGDIWEHFLALTLNHIVLEEALSPRYFEIQIRQCASHWYLGFISIKNNQIDLKVNHGERLI